MKIRELPSSSAKTHRFDAVWTPTVLLLDAAGKERVRLEGYLPNNDFMAALKNGLGRIAFVQKKYADTKRGQGDLVAAVDEPSWRMLQLQEFRYNSVESTESTRQF